MEQGFACKTANQPCSAPIRSACSAVSARYQASSGFCESPIHPPISFRRRRNEIELSVIHDPWMIGNSLRYSASVPRFPPLSVCPPRQLFPRDFDDHQGSLGLVRLPRQANVGSLTTGLIRPAHPWAKKSTLCSFFFEFCNHAAQYPAFDFGLALSYLSTALPRGNLHDCLHRQDDFPRQDSRGARRAEARALSTKPRT